MYKGYQQTNTKKQTAERKNGQNIGVNFTQKTIYKWSIKHEKMLISRTYCEKKGNFV